MSQSDISEPCLDLLEPKLGMSFSCGVRIGGPTMLDEKGRAQEIVRKLNQGDEDGAVDDLHKAFFELSDPAAFKVVVQEMQSITSRDRNSQHDIYYSIDDRRSE